jgi:hypothetical protein
MAYGNNPELTEISVGTRWIHKADGYWVDVNHISQDGTVNFVGAEGIACGLMPSEFMDQFFEEIRPKFSSGVTERCHHCAGLGYEPGIHWEDDTPCSVCKGRYSAGMLFLKPVECLDHMRDIQAMNRLHRDPLQTGIVIHSMIEGLEPGDAVLEDIIKSLDEGNHIFDVSDDFYDAMRYQMPVHKHPWYKSDWLVYAMIGGCIVVTVALAFTPMYEIISGWLKCTGTTDC